MSNRPSDKQEQHRHDSASYRRTARGAVLQIVGSSPQPNAVVTISRDETGEFVLTSAAAPGNVIATCAHPSPLRQYAWANSVQSIRHDYDVAEWESELEAAVAKGEP